MPHERPEQGKQPAGQLKAALGPMVDPSNLLSMLSTAELRRRRLRAPDHEAESNALKRDGISFDSLNF